MSLSPPLIHTFLGLLVAMLLAPVITHAEPPCQAMGRATYVFLGTVVDLEEVYEEHRIAVVTVDQVFKGQLSSTVTILAHAIDSGDVVSIGQQYVIYTSGDPSPPLSFSFSDRNQPINRAAEDLHFFHRLATGPIETRVFGSVLGASQISSFSDSDPDPFTALPGVDVRLSNGQTTYRTTTDAAGQYSFTTIPPGTYSLTFARDGYALSEEVESVELADQACVETEAHMVVDRRIEGTVYDCEGLPVPELLLELISDTTPEERFTWATVRTDDHGHYEFKNLRAGGYLLGQNLKMVPSARSPFPPTCYPNVADRKQALAINFTIGSSTQIRDIRLPERLPIVTVSGSLMNADGTPMQPPYPDLVIFDPDFRLGASADVSIDENGHFEAKLCRGWTYLLYADGGSLLSEIWQLTPAPHQEPLAIALKYTKAEWRALNGAVTSK